MISFWVWTLYTATFIKSEGDREIVTEKERKGEGMKENKPEKKRSHEADRV